MLSSKFRPRLSLSERDIIKSIKRQNRWILWTMRQRRRGKRMYHVGEGLDVALSPEFQGSGLSLLHIVNLEKLPLLRVHVESDEIRLIVLQEKKKTSQRREKSGEGRTPNYKRDEQSEEKLLRQSEKRKYMGVLRSRKTEKVRSSLEWGWRSERGGCGCPSRGRKRCDWRRRRWRDSKNPLCCIRRAIDLTWGSTKRKW